MDQFIGTICAFGFNYAPYQWSICTGQLLPINQYTALFSLLGTAYGGNGTSNFGLPDLCGCAAIGQGQGQGTSDYVMGEMGGAESVTVTLNNLPAHTHNVSVAIKVNDGASGVSSPSGAFPGNDGNGGNYYAPSAQGGITMLAITAPNSVGTAGGSLPMDIRRPYLAMTYCVSLYGTFPSRG